MNADNPWLHIPVGDYEGHMSHEKVGQLQALNGIFKSTLQLLCPKRICVLGCTSGNGFEHIINEEVEKVVGIDINSNFLGVLSSRFASIIKNLELVCDDIVNLEFENGSFDLIHGALFFEYVDFEKVLCKISDWLQTGGKLSVVLQLPSDVSAPVSNTPYESLKLLSHVINLVDPDSFAAAASKHGMIKVKSYEYDMKTGKKFFVGLFEKL